MGMFDKDKEIGLILQNAFAQGEQFIVWEAEITKEDFPTTYGPTPQATFKVSKKGQPHDQFEVTTLASAITSKVREASPDDFPAVVFWREAPSDRSQSGKAIVLQFVKAWGNAPAQAADAATPTGDDDIPF